MPKPTSIDIFLHQRVSIPLALLADFIFNFANRQAARPVFAVRRVHCGAGAVHSAGGVSVQATVAKQPADYLLVPPIDELEGEFAPLSAESELLRDAADGASVIATACLGAFLPAAAGLLDGRRATTHWRWGEYAATHFPQVKWDLRAMLCDEGEIITSGGLLSVIDLALYIVAQNCTKPFAHRLGQQLLADSVRQKQSVYARSLVLPAKESGRFARLEREVRERLSDPFPVREMAELCGMSVRTFYRNFLDNYGVSPNKYLQLKRIERAKDLLGDRDLSVEEAAARCGFADSAFFRTIFSRETGMTPSQYRKKVTAHP